MKGPNREKWQELCEKAANERDPEVLLKRIDWINRMLWKRNSAPRQNQDSSLRNPPRISAMVFGLG